MRKILPMLLALCLLSGCTLVQKNAADAAANTYGLYFTTDPDFTLGSDAVSLSQTVIENGQNMETHALAEEVVRRLLEGPADPELTSPFPKGTTLKSLTLEGPRATVDLSAAYGTLSGIQLTLADYCIALSLTQLAGISVVSVTVQGEELAYRNSQSFRARDVLLTSTEDVVGTLDVTLWFADGTTGALTPESRVLELYEGDTQTVALMLALVAGPETRGLVSALPEDFTVLSVWTEEDICYVNLPSSVLQSATVDSAPRTVQVLVESLCSLESIGGVQIRVDGESRPLFGTVPISGILQPKEE